MMTKLFLLVSLVAGVVSEQSLPVRKEMPAIASARDYYTQLYDAGGFHRSGQQYVCFNDDATDTGFFTFNTMAYDERYAKAYQSVSQQPTTADKQQEAWRTMKAIQEPIPYVDFLDDVVLGVLPAQAQAYLRQGGRLLEASFYMKGVKSGEVEYQWEENSWVFHQTSDLSANIKTRKTFRLSIEPATLRYIQQLTITDAAGSGETKATESHAAGLLSGSCEKIPDKRLN
jgi:hypothetical protein